MPMNNGTPQDAVTQVQARGSRPAVVCARISSKEQERERYLIPQVMAPDHGEHGFRAKVSTVSGAR